MHRNVHEWMRERSSFDGLVVVVVVVEGREPAAAARTRASSDRIIYFFFDNARRSREWRLESKTFDWLTDLVGARAGAWPRLSTESLVLPITLQQPRAPPKNNTFCIVLWCCGVVRRARVRQVELHNRPKWFINLIQ